MLPDRPLVIRIYQYECILKRNHRHVNKYQRVVIKLRMEYFGVCDVDNRMCVVEYKVQQWVYGKLVFSIVHSHW